MDSKYGPLDPLDPPLTQEEINDIFRMFSDDEVTQILRCECGAEKVKTTHTHYCPKYRK